MSAMFINVPLYSDINSYKVLSVNGNKGLAVEVRKEPKNLEFSGYTCLNNREAYSNAEPIEMGPTFEITKRGEEWYRKTHVGTFIPNVSSNKANTFNHKDVEVVVEKFKEEQKSIHINAVIYVERESQKGIIIGHNGVALKKVATEARRALEHFFQKSIYIEFFVKVDKDWRSSDKELKNFGYQLD